MNRSAGLWRFFEAMFNPGTRLSLPLSRSLILQSITTKMLLAELKKLAASSELISIDRNCHDDELTGILTSVSDCLITMQLFCNDGQYEGFAAFEFDQIEEVYWGNREHRAIRHLVDQGEANKSIELESASLLDAMLELNSKYKSLSIHSCNNEDAYDIAKIDSHEDGWCKIVTFSTKRSLSPMTKLVQSGLITRIVVDSPYQNSIVDLHSQNL